MEARDQKASSFGAPPAAPSAVDTTLVPDDVRQPRRADAAPMEEIAPTRAERAWMQVVPALVVLVIGIVFVAQNTQHTKVSFFTMSGTVPLAVALLGALALGAAAVALLGTIRIHQLRKVIRSRRRTPKG